MKVISIRLEDDLLAKLKTLAEIEGLDRTNLIKKLLRISTKQHIIEQSIERYSKVEITLEQAAELAETSIWEIMSMLYRKGICNQESAEELKIDAKIRLKELGFDDIVEMI